MSMAKVLVIGSVHLDILSDITDGAGNVDKIGFLHVSVGGAAFNVAANLAHHKRKVALLSGLKAPSFGELLIRRELRKRRIDQSLMVRSPYMTESGFVAHMASGNLVSAVSSMAVEQVGFTDLLLAKAIDDAEAIVVEANLSPDQIRQVEQKCRARKSPLYGCAVSESKVGRLHQLWTDGYPHFTAILMSRAELSKCGCDYDSIPGDPKLQKRICSEFSAQSVVIMNGSDGYCVVDSRSAGKSTFFNFPGTIFQGSAFTLGTGEALLASIVAIGPNIGWEAHRQSISEFLGPVLATKESAPEAPKERFMLPQVGDTLRGTTIFLSSLGLAVFLMILVLSGAIQDTKWVSEAFFAMALLAGASGALIASMLDSKTQTNLVLELGLGAVAGMLSAALLAVPYLDGDAGDMKLLKKLFLSGIVISFVAGSGSRSYLRRLVQRIRPPDSLRREPFVDGSGHSEPGD